MSDQSVQSIAVLGAGVVGLSTAINIQNLYPLASITVIAQKFNAETTSDGAAGLFRPTIAKTYAEEDMIRKWCLDSFTWFHSIWMTDEASSAGIQRIGGYIFSQNSCVSYTPLHCYKVRELSPQELNSLPGKPRFGYFADTLMIECRRYLPWLLRRFYKNGGKLRSEKIASLTQIAGQYDVYVNCLALSSRDLFGDQEMFPVKGHLLRVHAPWIKTSYFSASDKDTYIYPGQDNVVLGGTRLKGDETLGQDEEQFQDVFKRCCEILPALKHAPIIRKWIGIRPHRTTVRLEVQHIPVGKHMLKVVHNIGHGGDGVALSWGTAMAAAELVRNVLNTEEPSSVAHSKL